MSSIPTLETKRTILRAPVAGDQDGFTSFLMSERAIYAGGTQDRAEAIAEFQDMIDFWNAAVSYVAPDNKRSIEMTERLGARLDPDAATPEGLTCLVYRHPTPDQIGGDGGMEAYV